MISNSWIEKRKPFWARMGSLLAAAQSGGVRALSHEELGELAFLYRQIAADLSSLRQDGGAPAYAASLNTLLARAHTFVYASRGRGLRDLVRFFTRDYPALFRRLLPYTAASLVLFLAGALLGASLATARPEFVRHLLGPRMMATIAQHRMWTESVTAIAPAASSGIMTNNLSVTFSTWALGITAGLGTLYMIGWNGVLLGVVGAACAHAHMGLKLWSFVAPHGSLELPSIVIAGGAGLRLAEGVLFPGMHTRRFALTLAGRDSVRLLAGIIPLLVIAGLLEGFFSPSGAPAALKFALGATLFALLLAWLFSHRPSTGRVPHVSPLRRGFPELPTTADSAP